MIVVIMLSILPLAAISAALALSDYRAQTGQSALRVQALVARYAAREQAALGEADASVAALAVLLGRQGLTECGRVLAEAVTLGAGAYQSLVVTDAAGAVACRADRGLAAGPSVAVARALPGGGVLRGLLPVAAPAGASPAAGVWLVGPGGTPRPLVATREGAPAPATLAALGDGVALGRRWPDGAREVVVGARVAPGYRVVVADYATRGESRAASVLFRRIAMIAALVAAGLAAVAYGAHVTVAAPIQALTQRVKGWRTAGRFDRARPRYAPSELVALMEAFGLATSALAARELELERARAAQDLAFKEIHHRVKNNLQIIASLLNLQASRIRAPEARAEFQSARDRVRALATLHRHLYTDGGLHTIAMRSFLLELCGQLFQASGEREGHRITLGVEAPELQMSSDQAVPLALIVTEAVGNALKYAFPDGRTGAVQVTLRRVAGERIELVVRDDGVGIPAGRAETETGVRDGLGIQLIRGFAKQLGARLEVTEGAGTVYRLELGLRAVEQAGV